MDYKGVNIPKKVIIVAKPKTCCLNYMTNEIYFNNEDCSPAYVVDPSSKSMLDSALNWASASNLKLDENGNPIKYINKWNREEYEYEKLEGIQYEYDNNGIFEFELEDSANGSCQGGKLSFWNCKITAPDGKKFLIGINSDILLNLLKHNTFINGKCQDKVYLGRIKGNAVGAFTRNMELFEQAEYDESIRNASKTKKYNPGDLVRSKTKTFVYIGEIYKLFDKWSIKTGRGYGWSYKGEDYIVRYDKPLKCHLYIQLNDYCYDKEGNLTNIEKGYLTFYDTKQSLILCNKNVKVEDPYNVYIKNLEDDVKDRAENELKYNWTHNDQYEVALTIGKLKYSNTNNCIDIKELEKLLSKPDVFKSYLLRHYTWTYSDNYHPKQILEIINETKQKEILEKYKEYNQD